MDAVEKVASFFPELTEEDLQKRYEKSGDFIFRNYVAFARQEMKRRGFLLIDSPRGTWELSDEGKKKVKEFLEGAGENTLFSGTDTGGRDEEVVDFEIEEETVPLEVLQQLDPFQFERLCGKLFENMEFEDVQVTQRSGDGGIDGHGDLIFGLIRFQVVFQAKKYAAGNTVGAPDIQKLAGAKQQFGAEKAVFITTSSFSRQAKESAKNLGIELINGDRLVELLQKYKIGFVERVEFDIDPAFFKKL